MRALVASGGGALGSYILGVLQKTMRDEKRDYEILCGVSVGALIVGAAAQEPLGRPAQAFDRARRLFLDVEKDSSVFKKWAMHPLGIVSHDSVYSTEPLRKRIHDNVDVDLLTNSGKDLWVGATSWETGDYHIFDQHHPHIRDAIYASAAYPIMFEHGLIDGEQFADGGLRTITPLAAAIRAGATEIDVVMASNPYNLPRWDPKGKNILDRFKRMLDVVFAQIMIDDLESTGYRNDLATLKKDGVNIRVQMPSTSLEYFDSLDFDAAKRDALMQIGYKEAYVENF